MKLTAGSRHENLAMEVVVMDEAVVGIVSAFPSPALFLPQLDQSKWAEGALSVVLDGEGDVHCLQDGTERVD